MHNGSTKKGGSEDYEQEVGETTSAQKSSKKDNHEEICTQKTGQEVLNAQKVGSKARSQEGPPRKAQIIHFFLFFSHFQFFNPNPLRVPQPNSNAARSPQFL